MSRGAEKNTRRIERFPFRGFFSPRSWQVGSRNDAVERWRGEARRSEAKRAFVCVLGNRREKKIVRGVDEEKEGERERKERGY